ISSNGRDGMTSTQDPRRRSFIPGPIVTWRRNRSGTPTVWIGVMALIGNLHPLIVHFPIALVIAAAVAEAVAIATGDQRYRSVAVVNLRAGAIFAVAAVIAGWLLASAPGSGAGPLVEWHRWMGAIAASTTLAAAFLTFGTERLKSHRVWMYRVVLF